MDDSPLALAVAILLLLLAAEPLPSAASVDAQDLRFVSYTDFHLINSTKLFHRDDIDYYQHAVFDSGSNRIIVGARNHLVTFRMGDFSLLQVIPWFAEAKQVTMCKILGHPEYECHNFIKVLLINGTDLFLCGTSAHKPLCQVRPLADLKQVSRQEAGSGLCPHRPHSNNTFVLAPGSGTLFTGLTVGSHGHQHLVLKAFSPFSDQIRTKKSSHWLDDPHFVAMFDVDAYIYIFFREVAVEYIPWGKLIVSRVARICKGDRGGGSLNRNEFRSFIKARLNCSRPGEYPFHYDELQSISYDADRRIFTGAFTTSPNALAGSAICEYRVDDIDLTFGKNFKVYDHTCQCWRGGHANKGVTCHAEDATATEGGEGARTGPSLVEMLMIDGAAQPVRPKPLIEAPLERFVHLVAERKEIRHRGVDHWSTVLYLSNSQGHLKRYLILPEGQQQQVPCLIESIELLPPLQPSAASPTDESITFLALNPVTGLLLVGTRHRMYQVSKERCHRFNTKTLCESAQDPHCTWSADAQMCVATEEGRVVNSCPVVKNLRRAWYGWSDWSKCSATCGDGVQMRMLVCLDDVGRLSTNSDLRSALRCTGNNHVTRPCKIRNCSDASITPWSTWMSNDSPGKDDDDGDEVEENEQRQQQRQLQRQHQSSRKEKRFRCMCEQSGANGCLASLQVSERSCRVGGVGGACNSRLKRLGEKRKREQEQEQKEEEDRLRRCTKEVAERRKENVKMKKQIHDLTERQQQQQQQRQQQQQQHHGRHHQPNLPAAPSTPIAAATPTTAAADVAVRKLMKSLNSPIEGSKVNLPELGGRHHHNNHKNHHDNDNNNNFRQSHHANHLPDSDARVDHPHRPRPSEVQPRVPHHAPVVHHHFSLPHDIYRRRLGASATATTTTTTTTTSTTKKPTTKATTEAPICPTLRANVVPVNYGIFYGYCGCRDLGLFRVCHRCNGAN